MGGATSKEIFSEIVNTVLQQDVEASNHDFWDEMWKTVLPVEDIFDLISVDDVRRLISDRPENTKIIFTQAVAQLYQVVETPYPIYFDQALNCTRILARLLPFLLETDSPIIKQLLWGRRGGAALKAEESKSSGTGSDAASAAADDNPQESEPLAVILVNTIFHLLFLPDFTVEDPNAEFTENDIDTNEFKTALMWAPGVGSTEKTVVSSTQFDANRVDVLRLMIAAFSDSLYQPADSYDSCKSMWLEVATSVDAPYAEIVFYSLMNTVLGELSIRSPYSRIRIIITSSSSSCCCCSVFVMICPALHYNRFLFFFLFMKCRAGYDPVGWGLPYGNLLATDSAKSVMEAAVQTLVVLLDYGYPLKSAASAHESGDDLPSVAVSDTDAPGFNVFRKFLGSVEAPDQLNFIYRGFVRLLNNVHQAESTYLPYSITRVGIEQELLVLLWKCLEECPKFMPYVLKHCDINEVLVPICYFLLEGRRDPAKVGLMYLCTFMLLKLSGERAFGVALNKPYVLHLPVDVPMFSGNHADLLIIVLHKLIVSGLEKLSALYSCFLTIICNISPYSKSLCAISAVKLVNLLQLFVSPRFLYGNEGNHAYVGMLLETLNNIVQYQYEGNSHVIYAILRRREIFEGLAGLTLPEAQRIAREIRDEHVTAISSAARPVAPSTVAGTVFKQSAAAKPAAGKAASKSATAKAATAAKKSSSVDSDATAAPFAGGKPTEMVSTKPVERSVNQGGDVVDTAMDQQTTASSSSAPAAAAAAAASAAKDVTTFKPTAEWLAALKAEQPLSTIMRLLKHLIPQLQDACKASSMNDEKTALDFLQSTTMVGLLPVPHPIVIRKYQPNRYTCLWFTAFLWGVIFMHNQATPLFDGKHVKLFIVQTI